MNEHSEAFKNFEWQVRWYGIIILIAAVAAIVTIVILKKRNKVSDSFMRAILLLSVPCGLIGLRVIFGVGNPIAFTIGSLEVRWYGICIVSGMIAALLTMVHLVLDRGMKSDYALEAFLWAIPCGLVGARLYYVLTTLDRGWTFLEILNLRTGGIAIYGGVIGGVLGLFIFSRIRKIEFLKILDMAGIALFLGQTLGRYGNLINQEAYGIPITSEALQCFPFGVYIENCTAAGCTCGGLAHWHCATFFYDSMWNLSGFILLCLWLDRKKFFTGFSLCFFLIYEGIGRAMIEGLRIDSLYFLKSVFGESIRISQMLSIIMILGGLALGAYLFVKNGKKFKTATADGDNEGIADEKRNTVDTAALINDVAGEDAKNKDTQADNTSVNAQKVNDSSLKSDKSTKKPKDNSTLDTVLQNDSENKESDNVGKTVTDERDAAVDALVEKYGKNEPKKSVNKSTKKTNANKSSKGKK